MRHVIVLLLALAGLASAQRFYPDDPLDREPAPVSVGQLKERKLSDYYDLFSHQFGTTGERQPRQGAPIRAQGVSTLDEPMQGAWWEKRHYYTRMTLDQLRAGPGSNSRPAPGVWTVVSAKNEGITPGFVILDAQRRRFFIKFDPLTNPEMATNADIVTSRLFYAMGYHVPENHIVYFDPEQLEIGENVRVTGEGGEARPMTRRDLTELFLKVPKTADGRYRATASLALPGSPIGPPRYYGTRADDPNDIVLHEHRRDQRGLHVIDAWVAHDDSRAINNLDIVVEENGRRFVRHYQLDFGSTLGSGTQKPNSPRSGAYFFSWKESARQLFTLGLVPQYWALAKYPDFPSIGRFEWKTFDPERWVPEYPNPAFLNRLPDDEFWGAKLVTAFTDDEIRAIVETGELSDKRAEAWLIECLIERRNKIGRVYFAKVLPLDKFEVRDGALRWDDVGGRLGYTAPANVAIEWSDFNNDTGARTPIGGPATAQIPARNSGYTVANLIDRTQPRHRIEVFLRHSAGGAQVVGVERFW
jgi:hypothetical protein